MTFSLALRGRVASGGNGQAGGVSRQYEQRKEQTQTMAKGFPIMPKLIYCPVPEYVMLIC